MGYGKTYRTKWLEDLSGNQGTANQVLISTSAGIAWATASTIIGGPYLPLSGGTMAGNTIHNDGVISIYGTGSDLQIYHDGSNSYISNTTGDLNIVQNADDKNIKFYSDNSSGGTAQYFRLEGNEVRTGFVKKTIHYDNVQARFGDSGDLRIYHDGSNSYIAETGTGSLFVDSSKTNFQINGSTVMNINFDSKVGIGTTNPTEKLYVAGSIGLNTAQKIKWGSGATTITGLDGSYISFTPNNSEKVRFLANGTVGIGTTSPSHKLSLGFNNVGYFGMSYDSNANPYILSNAYLDGNTSKLKSTGYGAGASAIRMTGDSILFNTWDGTNADETITWNTAIAIASGGNVGIGTSSPSEKLEVDGNVKVEGNVILNTGDSLYLNGTTGFRMLHDGSNALFINQTAGDIKIQNSATDKDIVFKVQDGISSVESMRIDSSGNVGIGTTSPDEKLRVDGNIKSAGDFIGAALKLGFAGSANITTNDTNEDLLINPNGSGDILMHTTSSGNVGIGTTSPSAKLEVEGNILPASNVSYSLGSSTKSFLFTNTYAVSSAGALQILAGGSERMRIDSSGNVGIGTTSPSANLDIEDASGVTVDINSTTGDGLFRFQSAGTTKWSMGRDNTQQNFVIANSSGLGVSNVLTLAHSTGNVGIGTTSPASKLEVNGTATVDGQLNINGDATSSIRIGTGGTNAALIYSLTGDTLSIGANNATNLVCKTNKDVEFRGNLDLISNNALVLNNANNNNQMYIRNGGSNAAAIQFGHGTVGGNIKMVLVSDGKVGIGTTSPNSSSLLDVSSTTKGFLPPRMSTTQINAISSPAEGLTVYNTVLSTLCFFNGVSWQKVTSTAM